MAVVEREEEDLFAEADKHVTLQSLVAETITNTNIEQQG